VELNRNNSMNNNNITSLNGSGNVLDHSPYAEVVVPDLMQDFMESFAMEQSKVTSVLHHHTGLPISSAVSSSVNTSSYITGPHYCSVIRRLTYAGMGTIPTPVFLPFVQQKKILT
ncbi:unnamed protein product, partial [Allacma fusca]